MWHSKTSAAQQIGHISVKGLSDLIALGYIPAGTDHGRPGGHAVISDQTIDFLKNMPTVVPDYPATVVRPSFGSDFIEPYRFGIERFNLMHQSVVEQMLSVGGQWKNTEEYAERIVETGRFLIMSRQIVLAQYGVSGINRKLSNSPAQRTQGRVVFDLFPLAPGEGEDLVNCRIPSVKMNQAPRIQFG